MAYNFPDAPTTGQIFQGWTYDGEKWVSTATTATGAVRYDLPQGLTINQMAQARANDGMTKKNYIINGGMQISQENGATAGTATGYYPADMFQILNTFTSTWNIAQVASLTAAGSPNRIRLNVTAADAAMTGSKYAVIWTAVEGLRAADLMAGTTTPKQITIQFGVKAPAGTYCISLQNAPVTHSYIAEYTIAAGEANTNVIKSVTLTLAGSGFGTWATNNTTGIYVNFCLGVGPSGQTAANNWIAGSFFGSANQFNFMGQTAFPFELFDVGLYEGSVAPPFVVPDYIPELTLCKRYWQKTYNVIDFPVAAGGMNISGGATLAPEMRIAPSVVVVAGAATGNATGITPAAPFPYGTIMQLFSVAAGRCYWIGSIAANARLT